MHFVFRLDIIGVCKDYGEIKIITAKSTGREHKIRELTLVDKSLVTVTLTLWNNDAESFGTNHSQPVVLVKNARVCEYGGGKTISVGAGSTLKINPDIAEGHKLRGWFDNEGSNQQTTSVSARTGGGNFSTEWLTFHEVKARGMGDSDKAEYFQLCGTINLIRSNNAVYKACSTADCNKKVVDLENGQYRCEKCNVDTTNFKYRLMISVCILWRRKQLFMCIIIVFSSNHVML